MGLFNKKELKRIAELEEKIKQLENDLNVEKTRSEKLGVYSYEEAMKKIKKAEEDSTNKISLNEKTSIKKLELLDNQIKSLDSAVIQKSESLQKITDQLERTDETLQKSKITLENQKRKIASAKEMYKALLSAYEFEDRDIDLTSIENFAPTVITKLECLTYQDLRKEYKENEKSINKVLETYQSRYTTKTNKAIYRLMVLALQAELQNILSNMKFDKLDKAVQQVNDMCDKYDAITSNGSQTIAGTMRKFIGEIKYLFINAVKIEYEYYVKKERERAEQASIREQMRQEAEERKILEQQKKQVEKEESKYHTEMEKVKNQIEQTTDAHVLEALQNKIHELQEKLSQVADKKEEIINRQNGKAGNVYVISNLGSFGDNVFKVGMTRRLDPMDRVRELGDASVPFSFDVHAMIFSEDAVSLENKLHQILDKKRVNKINLRKEFFRISLDEIEKIVLAEDPAASFNRTMLAEQYRQSLSLEENN